ncbi:MAG: helix-turn-helix domain-containing protein [Flavobacteriaceae bacterium]
MSKKKSKEPICAVDYAFRRVGGKYKGRILWYLSRYEVLRFGELRRHIKDITTKMLTQTLRELESDGLVNRKVYREVPPKVEYSLTTSSKELIPFINYLREWGESQMEKENILSIIHHNAC